MLPKYSLEKKVAVVTGARRGIGKGIALGCADAGADVVVSDSIIDDGLLHAVAEEIKKKGRRSLAVQTDVTRKSDVDTMIQKAVAEFGTIDIMANVAGIVIRTPLIDATEEQWDQVVDIDLKGVFLCSQGAARVMMKQQRGCIINISSGMAFYIYRNTGAYCIAKAGVVMLTKVLAVELGKYNIRVNAIAPGMIKTDFNRPAWTNPEILKRRESETVFGRVGEVDDIVNGALFLAYDSSAFITGETLTIDGGVIAMEIKS